ncbi:hypothetical protein [Acinetobacter towneri]|uniref:hypothetical protein n=1 Tax=Acinetobacter towneri TaxID=202956 RepID=UPI0002CF986F|nr:hypothetical protein [Acinetobacter towneri]ENV69864.1 hypothetical protein F947_01285 [Acinetobacter towneri DSM 14962 = CIP 107472]
MFCSRWKCLLLCYLFCTPTAQAEIRAWTVNNSKINADVVEVTQLSQLGLYLKDRQGKPYLQISQLQKNLQSCENMQFAMNAGMFHPDYSPVGLYVEQGRQLKKLNRQQQGWGNFFNSAQWCTGVESSTGVFRNNPTICQSSVQSAVCDTVWPNVSY